ncbi:MAG: cupin domain-containing protein, partial [Cyanobacteria bacterium P01_A01_bin.135]
YFHAGASITYLLVDPEGNLHKTKLGPNLEQGEVLQLLVPGGYWKAAALETGEYGLLGEAVAPGFDYRDMAIATEDALRRQFPDQFASLWPQLSPYIRAQEPHA